MDEKILSEMARKARLYDSIQNAAKNLPDGWQVALCIENGYGGWSVTSPNDDVTSVDSDADKSLADQLDSIVEIATYVARVKDNPSMPAVTGVDAADPAQQISAVPMLAGAN